MNDNASALQLYFNRKSKKVNRVLIFKKVKESIPPLQSGIDSLFVLIYISVLRHMRCGALREPCGCRARRGTRRTGALQPRSHATCAGNPAFASA